MPRYNVTETLNRKFRASITLAYIPKAWRKVRVVFIPKAGKRDKTAPKVFRPISLSYDLLKTMEKIVHFFVKSTSFVEIPPSKCQQMLIKQVNLP